MIDQICSRRDWSSLIEEDSHLRGRAILILDFGRDTGKPFQELISGRAGFQVLKESSYRHASSAKTQAPLTLSLARSTSWQPDQSNMQTMICFPFLAGKEEETLTQRGRGL